MLCEDVVSEDDVGNAACQLRYTVQLEYLPRHRCLEVRHVEHHPENQRKMENQAE